MITWKRNAALALVLLNAGAHAMTVETGSEGRDARAAAAQLADESSSSITEEAADVSALQVPSASARLKLIDAQLAAIEDVSQRLSAAKLKDADAAVLQVGSGALVLHMLIVSAILNEPLRHKPDLPFRARLRAIAPSAVLTLGSLALNEYMGHRRSLSRAEVKAFESQIDKARVELSASREMLTQLSQEEPLEIATPDEAQRLKGRRADAARQLAAVEDFVSKLNSAKREGDSLTFTIRLESGAELVGLAALAAHAYPVVAKGRAAGAARNFLGARYCIGAGAVILTAIAGVEYARHGKQLELRVNEEQQKQINIDLAQARTKLREKLAMLDELAD